VAYDYSTLRILAEELRQCIAAEVICHAAVADDVLDLGFGRDHAQILRFTRTGALFLTTKEDREPPVSHEHPWRYLLRARIVEISIRVPDRILALRLQRVDRSERVSHGSLVFELLPKRAQAILLSEESGLVLGKWPRARRATQAPRVVVDAAYVGPPARDRIFPPDDQDAGFVGRMCQGSEDIRLALVRGLALIDGDTAKEFLFRAGIDANAPAAMLSGEQLLRLWQVLLSGYGETGSGGYCWREQGQWRFSGLQPTRLHEEVEVMSSISEAISEWDARTNAAAKTGAPGLRLRKRLEADLYRRSRTIAALESDLEESAGADSAQRMGHSLLAQLDLISPGQTEVLLRDIFDESGQSMLIALDPVLTPAANAARYLKRAARYTKRQEILPRRLKRLKEAERALKAQLKEVDRDPDSEEVIALAKKYEIEGDAQRSNEKKKEAHPRRYRTTAGWSVWAGRNNRENDILTHKLAAQNDIWFHAHGYAGSHVILRLEGRGEIPDRRTLAQAAGVAAYWSKGRTAKKVSVVYTQVKYVTRPKGGAPGLAHLRREKSLIVEPALLGAEEEST
jgi:predicted ribosome quality control (RQC) complex YloA/Tae2 family protein